ncbi:Cnl2/NKP2 family protein-domain-containing protein [Diplogelasinospora grovesii]|uniref:Cnl2/NKP2 family protein-domain-containing protein n=1 Tax=Diplogelasinospora grovesii TaxID=303347 RepID=A0AAN6NJV1_9PEZI|nr:Cnl2/NKP2 family protein-domain-containing protein [Diplogelasinospora grovesii]
MAPSESKILSNYLLVPSQLPAIISLEEFVSLFPRSLQSSAQIRSLYRDLQSQRNALIDVVAANIEAEAKRGKGLRRTIVKTRREAERQEYDDEIEIERALFGAASDPQDAKHSINSIIPELESAVDDLEKELQHLGDEEANLLASVRQTVGSMSDLRYGRLANGQLREQVLEGLADLQETCKRKN